MSDEGARRRLRRIPIESDEPIVTFALARVALTSTALLSVAVTGFPHEGRLAAVVAGVALPWALITLLLARIRPETAFSIPFALVDMAVLGIVEAVAPETYAVVRFMALLLIAVHAYLQGPVRGVVIAVSGTAVLIVLSLLHATPVGGGLLVLYDLTFFVAAVATAILVGRMRTLESASRILARDLSRRALEADMAIRRDVATSLHDGPIQELIGLDFMLAAARETAAAGNSGRTDELLAQAEGLVRRNVEHLRNEMVGLGPEAFDELSFGQAVETSADVWKRRYGIEVKLDIERLDLPSSMEGDLFRIAQEAVANAGRHSGAETVSVELSTQNRSLELRVADDGQGFRGVDAQAAMAPGHLGLAAMKERASLLGGQLSIESTPSGSQVIVRAPLADRPDEPGGR